MCPVVYCGDMTEHAETGAPVVTPHDVERLEGQLKPSSLQTSAHIYTLYVRLMESDRRPIAHRTALGHALRRAGWKRSRLRKRVAGKPTEEAGWLVPGVPDVEEDRRHVLEVMGDLGEGEHPNTMIFQRYAELGRRNGWRGMLSEHQFAGLLTRMGYVRTTVKGVPCRIVLARIVRPDLPSRFYQG